MHLIRRIPGDKNVLASHGHGIFSDFFCISIRNLLFPLPNTSSEHLSSCPRHFSMLNLILQHNKNITPIDIPSCPKMVLQVRHLGNAARGPPINEVAKNFICARELIRGPSAGNYDDFKQQCESLRLFIFAGVVGILALDLFMRPPRSSYWRRFAPSRLLATFVSLCQARVHSSFMCTGDQTPWINYNALTTQNRSFYQ